MTALFNAGFDGCSAAADIALYPFSTTNSTNLSFVTGSYGTGKALKLAWRNDTPNTPYATYTFPTAQTGKTLIFGFDFSYTAANITYGILNIFDGSGTGQISLVNNATTKQLEVRLISYSGTVITGAISTKVLHASVVYSLEFKLLVHNSAGTLELKINGETQFSLTGKNTQGQGTDNVSAFQLTAQHANPYVNIAESIIDNFYCLNTDGSAPWNNYLGTGYVSRIIKPDGDSSVQFTSSSGGANYTNIDDDMSAWVASTDNNNSSTLNHTDVFTLTTLSAVNNVAWLSTLCRAKRDAAGARSLSIGVDSGGTVQQVEHGLGTSYETFQDIFTTSDGASTTFTQSTLDSLLARYKVTV